MSQFEKPARLRIIDCEMPFATLRAFETVNFNNPRKVSQKRRFLKSNADLLKLQSMPAVGTPRIKSDRTLSCSSLPVNAQTSLALLVTPGSRSPTVVAGTAASLSNASYSH